MDKIVYLDFGSEEYLEISWQNAFSSLYYYLSFISLVIGNEIEENLDLPELLFNIVFNSDDNDVGYIDKTNRLFEPILSGLVFKLQEEHTKIKS